MKSYKILIFNTFKKNIYLNFDWPNLWWRKSQNLVSAVGDGADVIKSLSYLRTATHIWHLIVRCDVECNFIFMSLPTLHDCEGIFYQNLVVCFSFCPWWLGFVNGLIFSISLLISNLTMYADISHISRK